MGVGNTNHQLDRQSAEELNTFLSRDGGLNWQEVRKGPHIYEIGDHGGLIVMAEKQNATNEIYYSWNEGKSWETL